MINLSFKEYLKQPKPEYQDIAARVMGIEPKDREGQVYLAANVKDGKDGYNVVPMIMGKAHKNDKGDIIGNDVKLITNLPGQRLTRRYVKQKMQGKDQYVDMGLTKSPNKTRRVSVSTADDWINQGAQGGAGMGGPPGL